MLTAVELRAVEIRPATAEDWPALWPMLRDNARAGETYMWERDISEDVARAQWMKQPPGRTVVAVDADGTVLGTAYTKPNQDGPGDHVANASFLVDPALPGAVSHARCASTSSTGPARTATGRCSSTPSSRRTRGQSRSGSHLVSRSSQLFRRPSGTRRTDMSGCT